MSILIQPRSSRPRHRPGRSALWFAVYLLLSIGLGGLLGIFLARQGLNASEGLLHTLVENHGAARVMRRVQTLAAVLLAPWMLSRIGWQGFNDLGWSSHQLRRERWRDARLGYVIGLLFMAGLFALSMLLGVREWKPDSLPAIANTIFRGFLITGLGVGILEETMARGVLYRSMARAWTPWTAAIVSSLLFAYVHFLRADPAAMLEGFAAAMHSSLFDQLQSPRSGLKFFNLFLFGIVLCRMVAQRDDIWCAVGLHASAVGIIKLVGNHTRIADRDHVSFWLGPAASFDEGWLLTCLLLGLLGWLELFRLPASTAGRLQL